MWLALPGRQQEQLDSAQAVAGDIHLDPRAVSIIPTQDLPALHPANKRLSSNEQRTTVGCADDACERLTGTPGGAHWWKGSQWHMLGRLFVEYVLHDEQVAAPAALPVCDAGYLHVAAHIHSIAAPQWGSYSLPSSVSS